MRVPDLQTFRHTLAGLACDGTPFDVRDRLVLVPTRAAAAHLVSFVERRRLGTESALLLPDFVTRTDLHARLADRLVDLPAVLNGVEREVLMSVACRRASGEGSEPPFRLRPGLVAEIVRLYDTLRLNLKDVDTFERLALGMLEPGAAADRGAERLVRQTRFLVAAYRAFEDLQSTADGLDEHRLRQRLLSETPLRPWRHVVVAVGDRAGDPHGLYAADWDLLTRIPGLERLDVICTDGVLAGPFHERIHHLLPGIEESRMASVSDVPAPTLLVASDDAPLHVARDREEEVAGFARWVRSARGRLDGFALVVRRPLPYVYISREVLASAGVPSQMFDALPLAAEPFAAALDLVVEFVTSDFARQPGIALLRSPHFHIDGVPGGRDVTALDRALAEVRYLGGLEALERISARWNEQAAVRPGVRSAAAVLLGLARELAPFHADAPQAEHLDRLLAFVHAHARLPAADDPLRERILRARTAIVDTLATLRDAHARFDAVPMDFQTVVQAARRWIDVQTFAPRTGEGGVHVVDADSARFGDFERVQLAGLVEGEWPDPPSRNIFYPPALLRELGWPSDADRVDGARTAFADLLRLPTEELVASTFALEDDALVSPSTLADVVSAAELATRRHTPPPAVRVFEYEALAVDPVQVSHLAAGVRGAVEGRIAHAAATAEREVATSGHRLPAYSLSALERYQDCPFKFFAADVLRLEEPPRDEPSLSPREHGRLVHEVFQRFFEAWDARGAGTITVDRLADASALFEEVAAPILARLPESDAALERARLFGSAVSPGVVDVVLGLEASRPSSVQERWLEYRLEGQFSLGHPEGRTVALRGVADRIDLLAGHRLRVVDYKSGYPPNPRRALQVPIYAMCAQERLRARDDVEWGVEDAAYVAFSGKRTVVPVVKAGSNGAPVLADARARLFEVVDDVEGGRFPARPHELRMCGYCPYPSVCRKDYVLGE